MGEIWGCERHLSPERPLTLDALLDDFWKQIPIRHKDIKEVMELIKANKNTPSFINNKNWFLFEGTLLLQPQHQELYLNVFEEALTTSRNMKNEAYFFLSLLFLSSSVSSSNLIYSFIELLKLIGGFEINLKEENSEIFISFQSLFIILAFYINLITKLPSKFIRPYEENINHFEPKMNTLFHPEKQKKFINTKLLKNYSKEKNPWISIGKFIDEVYPTIKNDHNIRAYFFELN